MLERERLTARIRQIRRVSKTADDATHPRVIDPEREQLCALEARIAHLEALVQGLQDSVHRESMRLSKRVGGLEARTQPTALGKALSDDARARGLSSRVTAFFIPDVNGDNRRTEDGCSTTPFSRSNSSGVP